MNSPDAVHFSAQPQKIDIQSRPTHLIQIGWTVGEFKPRWVVMLREEGAPTIIHLDATSTSLDFAALSAAEKTLLALKIPVLTGGVDLGSLPPSAPFNFDGIFPGDEEFAELLTHTDFILWLKTLPDQPGD